MTGRKAPKQQAPQTIEEATALLGRYSGFLTEAEQLRADADAAIAAIQAARDAALAPIEEEAKGLFLQLRAWWGVAGETLTEGKRKSHELAGCVLGERTTPPSLKLPGKTKTEEAAVLLLNAGLAQLCRHKVEADKPAVLTVFAGEKLLPTLRESAKNVAALELVAGMEQVLDTLRDLGFRPVQKIEFFIDRAGAKPAAVEEVPVQEAAE
ncbi:MAG TPA: host-nuclease inhibitor Gam family protein [Allosphingosinicella sp.]